MSKPVRFYATCPVCGRYAVGRVDMMRRRVKIVESLSDVSGHLTFVATKTYIERTAPIPPELLEQFSMLTAGLDRDDLLFTDRNGGPVRHTNWYKRHYVPAVPRAGLPDGTVFHSLRHTCAALLLAQPGAKPIPVARRIGDSLQVFESTYAHLYQHDDDTLTDGLDAMIRAARATPRDADVRPLPNPKSRDGDAMIRRRPHRRGHREAV